MYWELFLLVVEVCGERVPSRRIRSLFQLCLPVIAACYGRAPLACDLSVPLRREVVGAGPVLTLFFVE